MNIQQTQLASTVPISYLSVKTFTPDLDTLSINNTPIRINSYRALSDMSRMLNRCVAIKRHIPIQYISKAPKYIGFKQYAYMNTRYY